MSTFAIDSKNDIAVSGGEMRIATGLEAALALAKHYAQTLRGEMMHAMTDGVRFFETAYNQPRLALFEAEFKRRVMQVPDVLAVRDFDARLSGENLLYSATIETIYGVGVVDNV